MRTPSPLRRAESGRSRPRYRSAWRTGIWAGSAEPVHWQGLLGSMRVRIVLTVVGLLALSAAVSIALLRGVLRDRLDEEITVALQREAEEFAILANGLNPETGEPFAGDFASVFDLYFAPRGPRRGRDVARLRRR